MESIPREGVWSDIVPKGLPVDKHYWAWFHDDDGAVLTMARVFLVEGCLTGIQFIGVEDIFMPEIGSNVREDFMGGYRWMLVETPDYPETGPRLFADLSTS